MPTGLRHINPQLRFEGIEAHPDHVFFLRFFAYRGNPLNLPYTLIEIKSSDPIPLDGQSRLSGLSLIVMERAQFTARQTEDPSLKWLHDKIKGARVAFLATPETVGYITTIGTPVTTYRVNLTDREFYVETSPPIDIGTWFVAASIATLIALGGLWIIRRKRALARKRDVSCPSKPPA